QVELGQPPLGLEQLVAGSDPARDLHGLPVQRLLGRRIPLPGCDLAEVAAHHGLDPRVTARMPDPRQRAVEQLPRARPVAALAVEEPEVVQVEQLFLEGLFLLAAQFFPGLERAIRTAARSSAIARRASPLCQAQVPSKWCSRVAASSSRFSRASGSAASANCSARAYSPRIASARASTVVTASGSAPADFARAS